MAQFDLYQNPRGGHYPLLLDVQADLLARLATRVVLPLTRLDGHDPPVSRLNPTATIDGVDHVLVFQELAAVPVSVLGEPLASLGPRHAELVAALDLLFAGL